jgi:hypothetical protein|tara:strand:+ start:3506 stop:4222 length:717 start_codon:yes stop_codon:yes gene_type:complete
MTDDLSSAYSSIYNKKEEDKEQLDEVLPAVVGMGAKFLAKQAGKFALQKAGEGIVNKIRGGGPSTMAHRQNQMQTAGYQPEGEVVEDVAITHLDGSTTEVIDVVKPEPLADKEDQEALHDRLWDQVAANLTTLGEMAGVRYQVSPVEELEEKAKKDYDGDGEVESGAKEYRGVIHNKIQQKMGKKGDGKDTSSVKETFNVKSPVTFSKPEEKVEETISEEAIEKYASSISKAHKSIKK